MEWEKVWEPIVGQVDQELDHQVDNYHKFYDLYRVRDVLRVEVQLHHIAQTDAETENYIQNFHPVLKFGGIHDAADPGQEAAALDFPLLFAVLLDFIVDEGFIEGVEERGFFVSDDGHI